MPRISCQKPSYQKPIRKRKHYYYIDPEESEKSHSYVTEIQRRPKKQSTRILYEDVIDGLPEYESDSPTDEEQEENNNYEIQTKHKEKQPKQIKKPKQFKKGITKSIKMIFLIFLLFAINFIYKMQKAMPIKIQLGDTLNPLGDYAGVLSINDERTLANLIGKVDKVRGFLKTGKGDGDLSRYFLDFLPISRP